MYIGTKGNAEMKKYLALVVMTISLILTVFGVGYTCVKGTQQVRGIKLVPVTAVESLSYSGTVEYSDSSTCNSKGSGIVQAVLAKNGDRVEKGDVILTVLETEKELSGGDILSSITSGSVGSLSSLSDLGASVTVYTAGRSGIMSGLQLEAGGVYLKGQTLFRVSTEDSYRVCLNVAEKDISKIKKGQQVSIDCRALPVMMHGTVLSIGDSASVSATQSGKLTAVRVTVSIDEAPDDLKTGYTADCRIVTKKQENTLLAPYSSVVSDESGSFVYRSEGPKLVRQSVETGSEYTNGIELLSGVSDGDVIVCDAALVADINKTVIGTVVVYR